MTPHRDFESGTIYCYFSPLRKEETDGSGAQSFLVSQLSLIQGNNVTKAAAMPSKEQWSNAVMMLAALVCIFMGFLLGRVYHSDTDIRIERAICAFAGDTVSGFVTLATRNDGRVFLYGRLEGLQGMHGMHIHDYGNLGDGCRATGNHYNPIKSAHGAPDSGEKHAGDLGNLKFVNRTAVLKMDTTSFSLSGATSVIGRSLVLHQRQDDLGQGGYPASRVNGASGERLACCVIAIERQSSL